MEERISAYWNVVGKSDVKRSLGKVGLD